MTSERVKFFASCSLANGRTQITAKEKMLLEISGDWLHMANLQPHTASVIFTNQWECLLSNSTGSLVKVAGVGHTDETFQGCQKRMSVTHINTHTLLYVTSNLLYLKLSASRAHSDINNWRFASKPGKINPTDSSMRHLACSKESQKWKIELLVLLSRVCNIQKGKRWHDLQMAHVQHTEKHLHFVIFCGCCSTGEYSTGVQKKMLKSHTGIKCSQELEVVSPALSLYFSMVLLGI